MSVGITGVMEVSRYGMHFAPYKCKVVVKDCIGVTPTRDIAGSQLEVVDSFVYLDSTISSGGRVAYEVKLPSFSCARCGCFVVFINTEV